MSREGSDTLNTSFNANFGNDTLDLTEVSNCEIEKIDNLVKAEIK